MRISSTCLFQLVARIKMLLAFCADMVVVDMSPELSRIVVPVLPSAFITALADRATGGLTAVFK